MADFEEPCLAWRKSTASAAGDCVQVAAADEVVLIRDSANREGGMLRFAPAAWSAFLEHARGTEPGPGLA